MFVAASRPLPGGHVVATKVGDGVVLTRGASVPVRVSVGDADRDGVLEIPPGVSVGDRVELVVVVGDKEGVRDGEEPPEGVREGVLDGDGDDCDRDGDTDVVIDGVPGPKKVGVGEQLGATVSPSDAHALGQGHARHAVLKVAPIVLLYVPSGHRVKFAEAAGQKAPAGHTEHVALEAAPKTVEKVPAGQPVALIEEIGQKEPAGQRVRSVYEIVGQKYPAKQGIGAASIFAITAPAFPVTNTALAGGK